MSRRKVATDGEAAALAFVLERGYRVVDTNVRPLEGMARGEIDIIAWDGDILCFIEVKARRSAKADPVEAVTLRKRRQLAALAVAYLGLHDLDDVSCRFDVIAVRFLPSRAAPFIALYPGAFSLAEG